MAATIRSTAFAALAAAVVVACTTQAEAQIRFRLRPTVRLAPPVVVAPPTVSYSIPYVGFASYFDGSGEHLTAVQYGSAAWRIGLEPGDRILAVNGVSIRYQGHGLRLLQAARYQGHATLAVYDWRSGLVAHRTVGLGSHTIAVRSASYVIQPSRRAAHRILRRLPR